MINIFDKVLDWLRTERETYQTTKFEYEKEKDKSLEFWNQQFSNYIQRILLFPQNSLQHKQAALKLSATVVAYCESLLDDNVFPTPGVSSGTLIEWTGNVTN